MVSGTLCAIIAHDPTVRGGTMNPYTPRKYLQALEIVRVNWVAPGTPIVVLEAMKMEHTVRAPADGVISAISMTGGDQVESGQVLVVFSADEQGQ
ncbi:MAG: biotin/lipoyl-containing protein [Mycobacterium sp.]